MASHSEHQHFASASFTSIQLPSECVGNADIEEDAGIEASKIEHPIRHTYAQAMGAVVASVTKVGVHISRATGTIVSFEAALTQANVGAATVTVDLKKNGTTCLTGAISFSSADANYAVKAGTLSVTTFDDDDVFELTIVATAGGGTLAQGLTVHTQLYEDATP